MHEVIALDVRIPVRFGSSPSETNLHALFDPWRDADHAAAAAEDESGRETGPDVELDLVTDENLVERASSLSSLATFAALEHLRGRELLLHAAGVADEQGRVAAFVGPSGRGKTTASRELGRHYGYVSDETVSVDAARNVRSYRKPLSVIVDGERHKHQIAPSELGLLALPDAPLTLAALVLLDRDTAGRADGEVDASVPTPSIEPVPLCEAIAELVPQISYLAELPEPLRFIARLAEHLGGVKRVRYLEADTLPALVPALLQPGHAEPWETVLPAEPGGPEASDQPKATVSRRHRAAPALDAVESVGKTAVFLEGGMLHLLDGIGPALWRAVCAGRDDEGIVAAVREEFGDPPTGTIEEAVAAALDTFVEQGLVIRGDA